ncbi:MAG: ribbon-helix-helix protein, CopG family [Faecousia sp.]
MDERYRITLRLSDEAATRIEEMYQMDGSKSKAEFIERAILFYAGYLSAGKDEFFLPKQLSAVLDGKLGLLEMHMARVLFRLCVEISMANHVVAANNDVDLDTLERLRKLCVKEVAGIHGAIPFEDAAAYQQGAD